MASLTETAYKARLAIRYGAIGFVVVLVLWFAGVGFVNWRRATHPEPLPPARADFGLLPEIVFPESKKMTEFSLETPTGKLGTFPDRMFVFFAPNKRSSFGDADKAIDLARRMGFLTEPSKLSASLYRFTNNDPLPGSLEVDIVSQSFKLKRQWQADPTLLSLKRYINDRQAITDAIAYLRGRGLLPDDMAGQEKVSYWRVQGDSLVKAIALSDAEFVRVDLFRKTYDILDEKKTAVASYGFYAENPTKGPISVLLSQSNDEKKRVIEIDDGYIEIDYSAKGEYPIKTPELAWEELKNGQGYVASFNGLGAGVVRRVALGYFDSTGQQTYSMPVYVFTGDDELEAYVSAVRDDQLQK